MQHKAIQEKLIKAVQYQGTGDNLKAQALFLEIVKAEPANFAALYSLAAISANTGHHAAALAYANQGILIQPQFAEHFAKEDHAAHGPNSRQPSLHLPHEDQRRREMKKS